MEQPRIKTTSEFPHPSDDILQIGNHWNIARGHIKNLQSIMNRLYLDKRDVLPRDIRRQIEDELSNAAVGIHNLGQTLVKIDALEYDYKSVKPNSWEDADKTIYSHPIKTMTLAKLTH